MTWLAQAAEASDTPVAETIALMILIALVLLALGKGSGRK